MTVEAFRIQNFMGFENSGWIELRPITLLFGCNSVGKSAILRALLLLKQSIDSPPEVGPLWFVKDDGHDFGDYVELVRDHKPERDISFWFRSRFQEGDTDPYLVRALATLNKLPTPDHIPARDPTKRASISIRLIYGWHSAGLPRLKAVDLYDDRGAIILRATLRETLETDHSEWAFESESFDLAASFESDTWAHVVVFPKAGFLPEIAIQGSRENQGEEDRTDAEQPFYQIRWLFRGVRSSIETFLKELDYLGPLRAEPQRFYYVPGQSPTSSPRGQHVVRALLREGQDSVQRANNWLTASGLKVQLQLSELDTRKTLYELRLADTEVRPAGEAFSANIREVGFGLTQVLPIVVQAMLSPRGATLMIEQPELHLHPRAQTELGDLFVSAAQNGVCCILETHSEHLLLRLQTQIAKTTAGRIPEDQPERTLRPDQLGIYFIDRSLGISTLARIGIGPYGDLLSTPEGFEDFFSDDVLETATRMQARLATIKRGD